MKFGKLLGWVRDLAIIGLISLVLVEVVVRYVYPATDPPLRKSFLIDTRRDRRPYVMFGDPPYAGDRPQAPKPAGERRIVVTGGSTVEHGDPALPGALERNLRAAGHDDVRVYNYGVVGANSGTELARLVFDVARLEPDMVVMYNGVNDLVPPTHLDPRPGYPFDFVVYEHHPLIAPDASEYPWLGLLLYGSETMRRFFEPMFSRLFFDLDALRADVGYKTPAWRRAIADRLLDHVIAAATFCRGLGIPFLWVFQPTSHFKDPRTPEESKMAAGLQDHMDLVRADVRRALQARLAAGDLQPDEALDLSDVFVGYEAQAFWNSTHLLQPAREHVAARLTPAVADRLASQRDATRPTDQ